MTAKRKLPASDKYDYVASSLRRSSDCLGRGVERCEGVGVILPGPSNYIHQSSPSSLIETRPWPLDLFAET